VPDAPGAEIGKHGPAVTAEPTTWGPRSVVNLWIPTFTPLSSLIPQGGSTPPSGQLAFAGSKPTLAATVSHGATGSGPMKRSKDRLVPYANSQFPGAKPSIPNSSNTFTKACPWA